MASGADTAGAGWREVPAEWLRAHGDRSPWRRDALVGALPVVIAADAVRPSLTWLVGGGPARGGLFVRAMTASRDPDGFARLAAACDADPCVSAVTTSQTLYRAAMIMAAKGGTLADVTVGDVVELLDTQAALHASGAPGRVLLYRLLHQLGILDPAAPPTLRALRTGGQRSPEELIDRYRLVCRPVRDLLVDYLRERQPALDYNSLESLANYLGNLFWADLEHHHPGIDSLQLTAETATAWKRRLRTVTTTITTPTGEKAQVAVERINYRECLTPVRAFYLDLAHWAVEDPGRWAAWVAPCPIGAEEINRKKAKRKLKSRMDARTRERLPVLPVLIRSVAERRRAAATLLGTARHARPGETFSTAGTTLVRSAVDPRAGVGKVWVHDPAGGPRRDLVREEDHAFWAWAVVEVLRATGVRVEELLELNHHSLVRYRLPTTGEIVPLLQILPSKTDAERLLVVSPELADVLSAVILRVSDGTGAVPLVPAYDTHERVWSAPAPLLFQRRVNNEDRAISDSMVRTLLDAAFDPHRARRPGEQQTAALHAARLPTHVHHRRRDERSSPTHRPGHRRAPRHQRHHGLQGRLPRRGHPGPPRVPRPAPSATSHRRIPRADRRGMGGVPRSLRAAQGLDRHLRPGLLDALHPRARLRPLPDALARPGAEEPPRRDPRQPHRAHHRSRTRRLARRNRRTPDQLGRRSRKAQPDRQSPASRNGVHVTTTAARYSRVKRPLTTR